MIAALFVATNGIYFNRPDVDAWDITRDARNYAGPWPVVAHPPCSTWCQIAHVNQKRYGHKVGDDGGCFASALAAVRTWGGVLEHPAESIAWETFDLVRPRRGEWRRGLLDTGWVTEIHQSAYGHRARKRTWLYVVSASPVDVDWRSPKATATVSFLKNHGGGDLPRLSKKEAKATPPAFAELLISIARSAHK